MLAGQPLVTAFVVQGMPRDRAGGTHAIPNGGRIKDLKRPLESASGTVDILCFLMWIVAAGIIGSMLYLQAIERTRDFAVFKATGVIGSNDRRRAWRSRRSCSRSLRRRSSRVVLSLAARTDDADGRRGARFGVRAAARRRGRRRADRDRCSACDARCRSIRRWRSEGER